ADLPAGDALAADAAGLVHVPADAAARGAVASAGPPTTADGGGTVATNRVVRCTSRRRGEPCHDRAQPARAPRPPGGCGGDRRRAGGLRPARGGVRRLALRAVRPAAGARPGALVAARRR